MADLKDAKNELNQMKQELDGITGSIELISGGFTDVGSLPLNLFHYPGKKIANDSMYSL